MKIKTNIITALLITLFISSCNNNTEEIIEISNLEYPTSHKVDACDDYFGTIVNDPYRWLEDENSEETLEWINSQNNFTEAYLEKIPYREKIKNRLLKIFDHPKASAPIKFGDKYFLIRNKGLQDKSVLYYKHSLDGEEIELLNPNILSKNKNVQVSSISASDDAKYLAYICTTPGEEIQEIHIKEINSLEILPDQIRYVKSSSISWDKDGFFYSSVAKSDIGREASLIKGNYKIYYHKIGTNQSEDILIFEDPTNPNYKYLTDITEDKKHLIISCLNKSLGNALYITDLNNPKKNTKKIISNFENEFTFLHKKDNKLYFLTNYKAPKYKIIELDINRPDPRYWSNFIPEQEGVIESVKFFKNRCIVSFLQDAHSVVKTYDNKGNYIADLDNDKIGTIWGFFGNPDEDETFYTFSSFTTPATIYKYNINTNQSELYENSKIDFNSDEYITKQIFYSSKDSTIIPMFITHKKGIALDGNNPTLLFGFGGFNVTLSPNFNPTQLIWLEQGGIIAIANLRGGGEYGENWHKEGTLLKKQNVFDDFISAAEYLISEKYTSNKRLAIQGGSNGGLLIGAVTNQRPDLFSVALPTVSLMDMLRYHKYTVGRYWACEYGTCEDSKEMFEYIYKYSPLHNIKSGENYPSIFVTTADRDDRVSSAHSFKYIANLQNTDTGHRPCLIRIERNTNDEKNKPIIKIINEITDIYTFAFYNMNFTPIY